MRACLLRVGSETALQIKMHETDRRFVNLREMFKITSLQGHSRARFQISCILTKAMKKLLIFLAFVLGITGIMALILSSSHDFEGLDLDAHLDEDDV